MEILFKYLSSILKSGSGTSLPPKFRGEVWLFKEGPFRPQIINQAQLKPIHDEIHKTFFESLNDK